MKKVTVFAYSDINFDTRILKQCEALSANGYKVEFHGVKYGNHSLTNDFPTRLYFKRPKIIFVQYAQYFLFCLITFIVQLKDLHLRPTIIVHNMPNFLVLPFFISRIFGATVILDIHDDSPLAFKKYFKNRFLLKFIEWLEITLSLKVPHKLITVNRILVDQLRLSCDKQISVIHNYPNSSGSSRQVPYVAGNKIKLVYLGHLGSHYDLKTLIRYIEDVSEVPLSLDIYGDGFQRESLENLVRSKNMGSTVKFHGRYLANDIPQILQKYDIGVALYEITDFTNVLLPVKLLEYTENHLPSIASRLVGTALYFREDSLIYMANFEDFSKSIDAIYSGDISLVELSARAMVDIESLSWTKESIKFLEYVDDND